MHKTFKNIFYLSFLVIFLNFTSNNFGKKCFGNQKRKKVFTNSLTEVLKQSDNESKIKIPYGSKELLNTFPKKWYLSENNKKIKCDEQYKLLEEFMLNDFNQIERKQSNLSYSICKFLLEPNFRISDSIKINNSDIVLKIKKIELKSKYNIYSLFINSDYNCATCEQIVKQTQNILITTDSKYNLIDKLIISSSIGNDFGYKTKYFFIDSSRTIHLKDFYYGELEAKSIKYEKYKINQKGKFIMYEKK